MIQIVVEPTRAWIVGDSICASGPDILRGYEDRKLIVLPKFVLTGLGSLALRHHAQSVAHTLQDLDDAIDRMPKILRDGYRVLGLREHDATRSGFIGHTILCLGWSESRGHMVCAALASGNDFEPELHGSGEQGSTVFWRNPDIPREPFSSCPHDRDTLLANAHDTVRVWRTTDPCVAIGGTLHLATITRDSIVASVAGDLGMPAINETEHNMTSKTLASFMVAAALAGCGGTDDLEVTAAQLVANAATDAQKSTSASGTSSTTTGTGFSDPCTLSWTNNTGAAIEVQFDASVIVSSTATGTSEGFATSQLRIDDGTLLGYMLIYGSRATSGAAAPKQSGSAVRQLTVAAGGTVTATLRINAELALGIGTVTATWENASLRLTAIKR